VSTHCAASVSLLALFGPAAAPRCAPSLQSSLLTTSGSHRRPRAEDHGQQHVEVCAHRLLCRPDAASERPGRRQYVFISTPTSPAAPDVPPCFLSRSPRVLGINFQKASCTLDGCVKIWTSRVDSVATETGKLLSGLTETGSGEGEDAEDVDGSEGEDGDEESGKKKRKVRVESPVLTHDRRLTALVPPDPSPSCLADAAQHQHAGAVICVALDQEARTRGLSRPAVQEDLRRL
jgi:hypothetical protein